MKKSISERVMGLSQKGKSINRVAKHLRKTLKMYLLLAFQKITYAENLKPTQLVEQIKIYLLPLKAGIENSYVSYFSIKISEPHLI